MDPAGKAAAQLTLGRVHGNVHHTIVGHAHLAR